MRKTIAAVTALIAIIITVSFLGIMTNSNLADENEDLQETINTLKQQPTLVFHVSEKGENYQYARLPNATYTYNQLSILNNDTFNIILLPEYKGNLELDRRKNMDSRQL